MYFLLGKCMSHVYTKASSSATCRRKSNINVSMRLYFCTISTHTHTRNYIDSGFSVRSVIAPLWCTLVGRDTTSSNQMYRCSSPHRGIECRGVGIGWDYYSLLCALMYVLLYYWWCVCIRYGDANIVLAVFCLLYLDDDRNGSFFGWLDK